MKNALILLSVLLVTPFVFAHMSPPLTILSEDAGVRALMPAGLKVAARDFRLTAEEQQEIFRKTGKKPSEKSVRIYAGRDESGNIQSAVIVVTEYTLHGGIRVAVAGDREGKITGAQILEVSEESYNWVKPLIDRNFLNSIRDWNGKAELPYDMRAGKMTGYYADVLMETVRNALASYEVLKTKL